MSGDQPTQFDIDPVEAKKLFDAIYQHKKVRHYEDGALQEKTLQVLKSQYRYSNLWHTARHNSATSNFNRVYKDYAASDREADEVLVKAHASFFDRESFVVKEGLQEAIRVFPPKGVNILSDVDDFFRNGIAFFRAAITIARHDNSEFAQEKYKQLFAAFCKIMQAHRVAYQAARDVSAKQEIFKKAKDELAQFNGTLARQLVDLDVCNTFEQAKTAINLVRGYQFKMAYPERFCTIREVDSISNPITAFYFSKPRTFSQSSLWDPDSFQQQAWYHAIKDRVGKKKSKATYIEHDWLDKFFLENFSKIPFLSPVPMWRYTPNVSNANHSTTVFFNAKGKVQQSLSWDDAAITEPYDVSDPEVKRALTEANHAQLISDECIQNFVTYHFSKWQNIYAAEDKKTEEKERAITIPFLHQTLVADGVIISSDFMKSRTMLDNKALANQAMRDALRKKVIYVNKKNPRDVHVIPKAKIQESKINEADYRKVELTILEVNNCVNIYEKVSRVRNNDITDSRELLKYAVQHLSRAFSVYNRRASDENMSVSSSVLCDSYALFKFLESDNHSFFTPYKSASGRVQNAVADTSARLKKIDTPQARDLDVLLRSVVELKCLVHETWLGSLRRRATNFIMKAPYIGPIANFILIDIPSAILKVGFAFMPWGWVGLAHWAKHHSKRRNTYYKSAYELGIGALIGTVQTGCMSDEDRGPSVATFAQNLLLQFNYSGYLTRFNGDKTFFMENYCDNTEHMHNVNKITNDCSGTKLAMETHHLLHSSGLPSAREKPEELALSKLLKHNRKGEFVETKPDDYIRRVQLAFPSSSDASIKKRLPVVLPRDVNLKSVTNLRNSQNSQKRESLLKTPPKAPLESERKNESLARQYKPAAH